MVAQLEAIFGWQGGSMAALTPEPQTGADCPLK
jgi:hypothetical protein